MRFTCLLFLSIFSVFSAQATIIPVLSVHADYFPGRNYELGLDVNSEEKISQVYFQDDQGQKNFFSLNELESYNSIFKIAGFSVVSLRISSLDSDQSATVELRILVNSVIQKHRSLFFKVNYNPDTHACEIVDTRTGRRIHSANVVTHYIGPAPVGISDVVTE